MFVEEHYEVNESEKCYAKDICQDYRIWCEENGEKYVSNIALGKELLRLNIKKGRDTIGIFYGLSLK